MMTTRRPDGHLESRPMANQKSPAGRTCVVSCRTGPASFAISNSIHTWHLLTTRPHTWEWISVSGSVRGRLGGAATLVVLACADDRGCDGRGHLPDGVRARLRHAGDRGPRRGVTPPAPESASGQWLDAENTGAACRHIDGALVDERTHRPQGGGKWRAASRASRGGSGGRYPPVPPQPRCFP
jgi:hypothetical protein